MELLGVFLLGTLLCMLCSHFGWHIPMSTNPDHIAMHVCRGFICMLVAYGIICIFKCRVHMWVDYDTQEQQFPWPDHQSWGEDL